MSATRIIAALLLVAVPTLQASARQTTDDVEQLRDAIRERIELGHYDDAEAQARALVSTLEAASAGNQIQIDRASDLLVEASTKNGHGADADTRTLAEALVRRREPGLGIDAPALANALRNLG